MDDTGHIEIAKQIIENPLRPMSGYVNWENSAEPIHILNQPHLFFYLLAAYIYFIGESEIVLHLLMSLFSLLCILFFYFLATNLKLRNPVLWTGFLALGPGFIPSQNIMLDIPMLSFWLVFFWAILHPVPAGQGNRYYVYASLAAAAAILTKYLSLILLPILIVDILLKKRWNSIWVIAIPVCSLVGWSLFNYWDYGGIHILERKNFPFGFWTGVYNTINWIIALGAVGSFSILIIPNVFRMKIGKLIVIAGFLSVFIITLIRTPYFFSGLEVGILGAFFFGNGLTLMLACIVYAYKRLWKEKFEYNNDGRQLAILLLWMLGSMAFIILFTPFPAVRHVLVVIPAILLILGTYTYKGVMNRLFYFAIVITIGSGVIIGLSDWEYADIYRLEASRIKSQLKSASTVWFLGHWGWQWYAKKAGMKEYDPRRSHFTAGDYVILPELVRRQELLKRDQDLLLKKFEITVEPTPPTLIRTMSTWPWGGYYAFSLEGNSLPWTISNQPLEKFFIFKVSAAKKNN